MHYLRTICRGLAIGLLVIIAPGCGERTDRSGTGSDVTSAQDSSQISPTDTSTHSPVPDSAGVPTLEGDGLRIMMIPSGSARPLPFGTPEADAIAALTRIEGGSPREEGFVPDCGVRFATWDDGLTTYFMDGRFAGWSVRDGTRFTTVSGIGIGSTLAEVEEVYFVRVQPSSLGTEFVAGDLAGLLDSDSPDAIVTHLWAGITCIAR